MSRVGVRGRSAVLFFFIIFGVCSLLGISSEVVLSSIEAPDIEASITALYGSSTCPIVLFGQEAVVGEAIQANLDYGDGTPIPPFRDPLPVHTFCGQGCRNSDKSVISRIGVSSGAGRDVLLVVDIAGATGFQPGSAGYIRIINPEWYIIGVVAGRAAINTDYAGYGFRIDRAAGTVEWYGRGGCPACACHENGVNFVLLLRKGEPGAIDLEGSGGGPIGTPQVDIEAAITALYGSDTCPVVLFGQEASVGQVIQANLDYGDHTGISPFRDPLPSRYLCWTGGWRNGDMSVISRIGVSAGGGQDVLLFVDLAGARGFQPGSAGYIQILDPSWQIIDVVAGSATMLTDYAGYGFRIDKAAGRIEWYGRGGCPSCGCHENGTNFVLLLRKSEVGDTTPPALVQDFQASDGEDGRSTLTWTNPSGDDLAEVVVRRKTSGYPTNHTDGDLVYQNTSPVPGQAISYTDTGLTNGTIYYYAVFSRDTHGNWNDTVEQGKNADTAHPGIPAAPSDLRVDQLEAFTVKLFWQDNSNNEQGFAIVRNDSIVGVVNANVTTYTDTTVWPNSDYCYVVYAFNDTGWSGPSNRQCLHTPHGARFSPSGSRVVPEEGGTNTEFYYVAVVYDSQDRRPSYVTVSIDGVNYAMEYDYKDLAGFHYTYGPVTLPPGVHRYGFFCRIEDEYYWYPDFGETLEGPTVLCEELPASLSTRATALRHDLIGDSVGPEGAPGVLDEACSITATVTSKFLIAATKELAVQLLRDFLGISKGNVFKDQKLALKEGYVIGISALADMILRCVQPEQFISPYLEAHYRQMTGLNAAEQAISSDCDVFLTKRLCATKESATVAFEFLIEALKEAYAAFHKCVRAPEETYETYQRAKDTLTFLQLASVGTGGVASLITGGTALAFGVMAAKGLGVAKLYLSLAQAAVVGVMWGEALALVDKISSDAGVAYNMAGLAVETGRTTFPSLEIVTHSTPLSIRFGEVKEASITVRNTSDVNLLAQPHVRLDYGPAWQLYVDSPVGDAVSISPGEEKTFHVPVWCPPEALIDLWIISLPDLIKVTCYVEYGWLSPHGKRVASSGLVMVEPLLLSVMKDVSAYFAEPRLGRTAVRQLESRGASFDVVITVTNHSNRTLNNVTVRDQVPSEWFPFVVQFDIQPTTVSNSGDEFSWVLSLGPGETKYLRYTVMTAGVGEGQMYGLRGATAEYVDEQGHIQITTSPGIVDMVYSKRLVIKGIAVTPPRPVVGRVLKVVVDLENPGNEPVEGAVATVRIPPEMSCSGDAGQTIGVIPPGGTVSVEWELTPSKSGTFPIRVEVQAMDCAGDVRVTVVDVSSASGVSEPYVFHGPNPVPPEGCIFWLNLPSDATAATLKIFAVDGALLVSIPLDPTADRYPASGRWRPEDDHGRLLGTGLYLYTVEIRHSDGRVTSSPVQKMVVRR